MKHLKIEKVSINEFEDQLKQQLPQDVVIDIVQSQRSHPRTRRQVSAMEYYCERVLVAVFLGPYRYGFIYTDPIVELYGEKSDPDAELKEDI